MRFALFLFRYLANSKSRGKTIGMNLIEVTLVLFLVGFGAGVVDAIAGGGGLLTFPTLLLVGLPPAQALATNKIQALASVASSAYRFAKLGEGDKSTILAKVIASAIGGALGALAVAFINPDILAKIVPFILIGIALFFLFSPTIVSGAKRALIGENTFAFTAAFPIGFYDGFFGPGTGSLYAAAFVILLGRHLRSATADTKLLNTTGSLIAAVIFLFGGLISWPSALAMSAGGILGAQLGAHLAVRWGAQFIRIALVLVSLVLALRLLNQQGLIAFF